MLREAQGILELANEKDSLIALTSQRLHTCAKKIEAKLESDDFLGSVLAHNKRELESGEIQDMHVMGKGLVEDLNLVVIKISALLEVVKGLEAKSFDDGIEFTAEFLHRAYHAALKSGLSLPFWVKIMVHRRRVAIACESRVVADAAKAVDFTSPLDESITLPQRQTIVRWVVVDLIRACVSNKNVCGEDWNLLVKCLREIKTYDVKIVEQLASCIHAVAYPFEHNEEQIESAIAQLMAMDSELPEPISPIFLVGDGKALISGAKLSITQRALDKQKVAELGDLETSFSAVWSEVHDKLKSSEPEAKMIHVALTIKTLKRLSIRLQILLSKQSESFKQMYAARCSALEKKKVTMTEELLTAKYTCVWQSLNLGPLDFLAKVLRHEPVDPGSQRASLQCLRSATLVKALSVPSESGFDGLVEAMDMTTHDSNFGMLAVIVEAMQEVIKNVEFEDGNGTMRTTVDILENGWVSLWDAMSVRSGLMLSGKETSIFGQSVDSAAVWQVFHSIGAAYGALIVKVVDKELQPFPWFQKALINPASAKGVSWPGVIPDLEVDDDYKSKVAFITDVLDTISMPDHGARVELKCLEAVIAVGKARIPR